MEQELRIAAFCSCIIKVRLAGIKLVSTNRWIHPISWPISNNRGRELHNNGYIYCNSVQLRMHASWSTFPPGCCSSALKGYHALRCGLPLLKCDSLSLSVLLHPPSTLWEK